MISESEFSAIAALDLDPIKAKLMCNDDGEGWTLDQANAVEFEYRRFLYLAKKFPHEPTPPLVAVDTFWHYHILDTMKYATDCDAVFGYFLHHIPHAGPRGKDDEAARDRMGERMRCLYEETFGDSDIRTMADDGAQPEDIRGLKVAQTAYCILAGKAHAQTAYCILARKADAQTAYCILAHKAAPQTAYCIVAGEADAQAANFTAGTNISANNADDGALTGPLTRQTSRRKDNARLNADYPAIATV